MAKEKVEETTEVLEDDSRGPPEEELDEDAIPEPDEDLEDEVDLEPSSKTRLFEE